MDEPKLINHNFYRDSRGFFRKVLDQEHLRETGIETFQASEMFTTSTKRYGVRGMHVQIEPFASRKLVWVTEGEILDVLVNLRTKTVFTFELSRDCRQMLYIPRHFAHGFQVLSRNATLNYLTDVEYNRQYDTGFHVKSFDFNWPKPIGAISERDQNLADFKEFNESHEFR